MKDESNAPTLRDVADASGMSVASVSKVLNNRGGVSEEGRLRIMEEARRLGYHGRAERTLKRAGVDRAMLAIPAQFYSHSIFYEDVLKGVLDEAKANSLQFDVQLVPREAEGATDEIIKLIEERNPGAFLALGLDDQKMIDHLLARDIPTVVLNGMDRSMRVSCALPDNWSAGWLATQRLLDLGHREIMHVTRPERLSLRRRMEGFRVALEEAGIGFDHERDVLNISPLAKDEGEAHLAVREALKQGRLDRPTAFFCSTDVVALGLLRALQEAGRTAPDDYSVISVDDVSIAAHCNPPLTTMRIDRVELGRTGVQLLLERIAEPDSQVKRINLGVALINRESVGPPRTRGFGTSGHDTGT